MSRTAVAERPQRGKPLPKTLKAPAKTPGKAATARNRVRQPPQKAAEPVEEPVVEVEAAIDGPEVPDRVVDGKKVVGTEYVYTGLQPRPGHGRIHLTNTIILVLDDGTKVFSCVQCDFVGTRGEVTRHRTDEHGAAVGGWQAKRRRAATETGVLDETQLNMTLGQLITMSAHVQTYGDIIERLEAQNGALRDRAEASERRLRDITRRMERAGMRFALED